MIRPYTLAEATFQSHSGLLATVIVAVPPGRTQTAISVPHGKLYPQKEYPLFYPVDANSLLFQRHAISAVRVHPNSPMQHVLICAGPFDAMETFMRYLDAYDPIPPNTKILSLMFTPVGAPSAEQPKKPTPMTHLLTRTSGPFYPAILATDPPDFTFGLSITKDKSELSWMAKSAWHTSLPIPSLQLTPVTVSEIGAGASFLKSGKFSRIQRAYYVPDFQREMHVIQETILHAVEKNILTLEQAGRDFDKLGKILDRAVRGSTIGEQTAAINLARNVAGKLLALQPKEN